MKKLLFGLVATMMLSTFSFGQAKMVPTKEAQKIHIEIGRKSKDCGGLGICVFKIDLTPEELIQIINAFKTVDNQIKISFSQDFYKKNKGKLINNIIVIEEEFKLDEVTSKALGFEKGYTIKPGKYPIVLDDKTNTYNCTF